MIKSGMYSFPSLIESIKQETGIRNLVNEYPSIRKMVHDAVFDINPWGTMLVKKKMLFFKGNGNFDGLNIKKPADFVMIAQDDNMTLHETPSHFMICDKRQRGSVYFTYWALQCDGNGDPIISNNHAPAVVAYIVWKMYNAKVFMGEGSAQLRREYKQDYETLALAARGHDAFPSNDTLYKMRSNAMMTLTDMDYKLVIDRCVTISCLPITDDNIIPMTNNAWHWQLPSHMGNTIDTAEEVTDAFLEANATKYSFTSFLQGINFNQPYNGIVGFCIEDVKPQSVSMVDALGADTRNTFNHYYDFEKRRLVIVSKNNIAPSSIYLKFLHNGQ